MTDETIHTPELLAKAVSLHQAGNLKEAVSLYRTILSSDTRNYKALTLLGTAYYQRGQRDEAIKLIGQSLEINPRQTAALNNRGNALLDLGRPDEALVSFDRCIALDPEIPDAHSNRGNALVKLNRPEDALASYDRALALRPDYAEAHNNRGNLLIDLNRLEEALASYDRALALKPDYPEAHNNRGIVLEKMNRLEDALASYDRALALRPDYAEAHYNRGVALSRLNRPEEALASYDRALALRPDYPEAHNNRGLELIKLTRPEEGQASCEAALALKPGYTEAQLNLAFSLNAQGKYPQALESYRAALALAPDNTDAVGGAASMLERLDRIDEAREILAPAIEKGIDTLSLALPYAAVSRYTGEKQQAAELLESMLADENGNRVLRRQGHFMLGKLHDGDKNYDRAFKHYRAANELDTSKFDIEGTDRYFQAIVDHFGNAAHHRRPRASNRSRLPVFIVGMPRSGTTLTEQILASHPEVHGAGELLYMVDIRKSLPALTGAHWPKCMDLLDQLRLDKIAQEYLERLAALDPGKARVTDKLPHNFLGLGLIDLLFPEARVIHCRRDPMDNCLSIYFLNFNQAHAYSKNLEHLGLYYRHYERLMAHWRTVLRVPVLDIDYEETVAQPEQTARRLIEFVGLDWDDRCLRFYESERVVATPSYDQVRQPIYDKSVARWKHYERHLEPLKRSLGYVETGAPASGN